MKNKLTIFLITFIFLNNFALANEFNFETKNLVITEKGEKIDAGRGKAYTLDNELVIIADEFEYFKNTGILIANGNGLAKIKSRKLEMEFKNAVFNEKDSTITASGSVRIFQEDKKIKIKTEKIIFNQSQNTIISETKSTLQDDVGNTYMSDSFLYEINKNILKVKNLEVIDKEKNNLTTPLAYINTESGKLFGKDVNVNLNSTNFDNDNEPRLKGVSVINDDESTIIQKGIFTTCKKRDGCPPWQITAENIQHDKKNKTINYKNAFLRVYDTPIMYFPKFFHPDPTVKRRSGFLVPTIKNSPSSDNYFNLPYFWAIAENKDATFSPRLYADDKILLQTEYRQVNSNSNHFADFSLFAEKKENSKNHFFYEYDKSLDIKNFDDSKIDLIIQKTSNDTYLKTNKLNSKIITDTDVLENSFGLSLYSNNLSVDINSIVYENLNKDNNDRYEYILPKIDVVKKINNKTNLNGDFFFKSQNLIRNYDTNVFEKTNINNLIFNSYPKITKSGYYNNYEFVVKNSNTDAQNSKNFKKNENFYLSSIFQFNSSLPLIKENNNYQKILKPRLSLRFAPSHTKDERNDHYKIDVNNIYSLNRTTDNYSTEGGLSATYGTDYSIFSNKENNREIFGFKLANNLRFDENYDLPKNNQIGQKTSNFFSEILFSPNEFFSTKYNASLKNNLNEKSNENLITEFKINNLVTSFDYLNENNTKDQSSYLSNTTKYSFDNFNSISFSTRENKTADITEYYNFMYQYKNDCLAASIDYSKDFYNDRDLKPDENIFFKLTIIPFGQTSSPNLKN